MKKTLPILLLSLASLAPAAQAQEVYNFVMDNATRTLDNPSSNFTQTRIAQFKRTALTYLRSKAFETMPQVTNEFLNTQAYYLSEFLSTFFSQILRDSKLSAEVRKQKIFLFMDASVSNPLFSDPDKETTESYINEGSELTPFSLDTDWQKAYLAAKSKLEE